MKKILTPVQIREADAYTIENEPIASIDLMERAGTACVSEILGQVQPTRPVSIFCGKGNNGGDGLVIARNLAAAGFRVRVFIVEHSPKASKDFEINLQRLVDQSLASVNHVTSAADLPDGHAGELVVDALLGSGLNAAVKGLIAEVITFLNRQECFRLAIDLPSGMLCDAPTDERLGTVFHAHQTLSFEAPKLGFFFSENEIFTGAWKLLPIGLHPAILEALPSPYCLLEEEDPRVLLKPRGQFAHKGSYGHALLVAGSYGKMGAAVLGAKAVLRAGAGLLTVHVPPEGYAILQTSVPEAMLSVDTNPRFTSGLPDISTFNAIAIGPGIGKEEATARALKLLIQNTRQPLVLDADALNLLSENKTWLSFLPPGSICTPHPKEFERLAGKTCNGFQRVELQRDFSRKYQVYVILKGANSSISFPDGRVFFNPTGNPGMATAGSGDVLTGIVLGLLARGYSPSTVSLAAPYLHGLAGDLAAKDGHQESLIASDLTQALPQAFKQLSP